MLTNSSRVNDKNNHNKTISDTSHMRSSAGCPALAMTHTTTTKHRYFYVTVILLNMTIVILPDIATNANMII